MYSFASDNMSEVHPQIMDALLRCNSGPAAAYGADDWTARLNAVYSELFERETFVFPTPTGTAANGLAIAACAPPHGAVFCHALSHIVTAECGAPEFYSGGARLVLLPSEASKVETGALTAELGNYGPDHIHQLKPAVVSITQATERGRVYTLSEIAALGEIARSHAMRLHMDGARFTNALVHLGATPAEMTWKSGVDILSFGTTKNGTMMSEAVIVFDKATAADIRYRHKRAGLLQSKMRYFSAQLIAYLEGDLWRKSALQANLNAQRLAKALSAAEGVSLADPVEANEVFVHLPPPVKAALAAHDIHFRKWADTKDTLFRIVASYADDPKQIAQVERAIMALDVTQVGGIETNRNC
ncbi:MAG: beta-eliminating lyase-related protein [Pseudomonadota bacterium]